MNHLYPILNAVWTFVRNNEGMVALFATAGVSTMPPPGSPISWRTIYTWIYDWAHQFPNIKQRPVPETPKPKPEEPLENQNQSHS